MFNNMLNKLSQELNEERAAIQKTRRIVFRYLAHWDKRKTIYRTGYIGNVTQLNIPGYEAEIVIHGSGYHSDNIDIRLMTPELQKRLDAIDAGIKALNEERKNAIKECFEDNPQLTLEQIANVKEKGVID